MKPSSKYTITYTKSEQTELDEDFILLCIEAHSQEDAMIIVNNLERYFKGITITCEQEEGKPLPKRRGRREQRAKSFSSK